MDQAHEAVVRCKQLGFIATVMIPKLELKGQNTKIGKFQPQLNLNSVMDVGSVTTLKIILILTIPRYHGNKVTMGKQY